MNWLIGWIRQPWVINAIQFAQYCVGIAAGMAAVTGTANPQFLQNTINSLLITIVGGMLIIGCLTGAISVAKGWWAWERIGLIITGLAFFALLPAASYYSFGGKNPATWIVLILAFWAVGDCIKRYRRIDWAYLDPAK